MSMLQATGLEQVSNVNTRPLCVDLDGTLVKSDTLLDSLLLLVRLHPMQALQSPAWALRGKAALKRETASRVTLDVDHLPYNKPLIAYLKEQKAAGRRIYLATGADSGTAERVAAHFDFFDGVLASDGKTNLTGVTSSKACETASAKKATTTSATPPWIFRCCAMPVRR
jgi:hypothetical protein